MPKILQAKKLNGKLTRRINSNYTKVKILTPYMYKVKYANLVLLTNTSANEYCDYIKAIRREHLEVGMENIILFYLENPSQSEYQIIRKKMNVNNYLVNGISIKVTFLVNDEKGFTLLNNYYFIDYSTDMIKEKYRIRSSIPIPCDTLTKRVNNEVLFKFCGI